MFYGKPRIQNTTLAGFKSMGDKNTVCLHIYPVPKLHEFMFKNYSEHLVPLGVLEQSNNPKWGEPSFSQPKSKTNQVIFLSDSWNLNRQLKCKTYPNPKICKILLKQEGFQYFTSLYLNI